MTWSDGTTSEGWLRFGEAQAVTVAIAAEVGRRLSRGEGRPGAFTPAALFGHELATTLGGAHSRERARATPCTITSAGRPSGTWPEVHVAKRTPSSISTKSQSESPS